MMARLLQEITDWAERAAAAQWSVTALARDCGVSVAQLERHFLKTWEQTPRDKLHAERMRRACALLERRERIKDIAVLLHYERVQSFTRAFTESFGYGPSKYLWRKDGFGKFARGKDIRNEK